MNETDEIVVCVSGGFQVLHLGHIRLFREAKKYGTKLVVLLNNDNWLQKKKGIVNVNQNARKEILESIKYIDEIIITDHLPNTTDMSVCKELEKLSPQYFINGGDRFSDNIPEYQLCNKLGIDMVFNVGGDKIDSSTEQLLFLQFQKYFKKTGSFLSWKDDNHKINIDVIDDMYYIESSYYDTFIDKWLVDNVIEVYGKDNMMQYCVSEVEKIIGGKYENN